MSDKDLNLYNRRDFIKIAGVAVLGFFFLVWQQLTSRQFSLKGNKSHRKVNLSGKPDGVYFYDMFLITKKGASLNVLSNRCTHAGCKLNQEHNGEILCACHGSRYKPTGEVLKGPALNSLDKLSYSTDPVSGEITIKL